MFEEDKDYFRIIASTKVGNNFRASLEVCNDDANGYIGEWLAAMVTILNGAGYNVSQLVAVMGDGETEISSEDLGPEF